MRLRTVLLTLVLLVASPRAIAQLNNDCMDCLQRQIRHEEPNRIWYESDGFCCDAPCSGYSDYELKEPDRGYGCLTSEGDGELVIGDFCNSSMDDYGCPDDTQPLPPVNPSAGDPTVCNGCSKDGTGWTPVVVNRHSSTFGLTALEDGVSFAIDRSGRRRRTAWTRPDQRLEFLWLDRNGDGVVTDASELFGSATPLRSGSPAANGFEAMRDLDWNGDGILGASDAAWRHLSLWCDTNHNGVSEPDELVPLWSSGVHALELAYRTVGRRDSHGNLLRYAATAVLPADSGAYVRRPFYDVLFVYE